MKNENVLGAAVFSVFFFLHTFKTFPFNLNSLLRDICEIMVQVFSEGGRWDLSPVLGYFYC